MVRIGSLFTGVAGLDMAVQGVFGGTHAWFSEIDKAASKVLAYRFPGVPNLGDITQIDWDLVEPVDVLCGGFPCQDVSAAGKRAGIKDGTRSGLWAVFAEAIDTLRPQYVVIENVRGLLSAAAHRTVEDDAGDYLEPDPAGVGDGAGRPVLRAAGAVLGDLADLGYDAVWATVAAADVGAPHRRERVFIVAADADEGRWGGRREASWGDVGRHNEIDGGWRGESPAGRGGPAAVSGDEPGVALLPTPAAGNFNDGEDAQQWLERRAAVKERLNNGNGMGMPLAVAVQLLPTPTTQDGANNGGPSQFQRNTLPLNAEVTLLPTPRSSDTNGAGRDGGMDLRTTVTLLPTPQSKDGSGGCIRIDEPLLGGQAREMAAAWGKYEPAIRRWEQVTGQPAPAPTEPNKNGNPRLSAAFSEWLMGWPAGWVTDPAIGISRSDQLRCVGNGVVSLQAAAALRYLLGIYLGLSPRSDAALLPTPVSRDGKDTHSSLPRASEVDE